MKIGQIIAIAIGGTCTISSIMIWLILLAEFGVYIEPVFIDATIIFWIVLEAIFCWIVVKLAKNKNIPVVAVSSSFLNLSIFLCMKWCGYLTSDFWECFISFYYPYLLLYIIGVFVVHQIIIKENEHIR